MDSLTGVPFIREVQSPLHTQEGENTSGLAWHLGTGVCNMHCRSVHSAELPSSFNDEDPVRH